MNLYILQQLGYEYNDETYYRPESGGGNPIKAYRSLKKAEAACQEANREALKREDNLANFCYDHADIISDPDSLGLTHEQTEALFDYSGTVLNELTDEQLDKVLEKCDVEFFEVVAVEEG